MTVRATTVGAVETPASRRDFLTLVTGAVGATGVAVAAWPFVASLNPSAEVYPLSQLRVDLAPIAPGQRITVRWRDMPIFIAHRTPEEIRAARNDDSADLPDPARDRDRARHPEWLVVVGVCTHLGCPLLGQDNGGMGWGGRTRYEKSLAEGDHIKGQWGGWFCPCHGSHFDTAGRVRSGPAPENLYIPPYKFLDSNTLQIG